MKYHPPTKFCVFSAMGYWELNGRPVSSERARYGSAPGAVWKESEVARELYLHVGYFTP